MLWRSIAGLTLVPVFVLVLAASPELSAQTTPVPAAPAKDVPAAPPAAPRDASAPPSSTAEPKPDAQTLPDAAQVTIPPELSESARRAYNQSLKAVSDLLAKKDYSAALAKLDALIAQRPREPQAQFLKGVAQTEQGQADAAVATFRTLTEEYPELPEPHNNLAVIYAQKGEYDLAQSELETAIKTAPDWPVAHENLGDVFARLAATQYARAQSLDKSDKSAPAKLALVRQILAPAPSSAPTPALGPAPTPSSAPTPAPGPAPAAAMKPSP
jgi:Flp pilus assembly protein TadD